MASQPTFILVLEDTMTNGNFAYLLLVCSAFLGFALFLAIALLAERKLRTNKIGNTANKNPRQ